ncbi:hypothetical protein CKO31_01430 [Thiohalocapsa halophila]|uniref:Uncharacterized protein n=1 Tax=Thiohalocapsa halophila TaxID=69359 RepID=A0ABS1CBY0_9GAMM|nr:hypothetical protein [Thiohalocapsa halophila]MBK1629417.1 hypothetical protein [Thiohalocapsa halophila]
MANLPALADAVGIAATAQSDRLLVTAAAATSVPLQVAAEQAALRLAPLSPIRCARSTCMSPADTNARGMASC